MAHSRKIVVVDEHPLAALALSVVAEEGGIALDCTVIENTSTLAPTLSSRRYDAVVFGAGAGLYPSLLRDLKQSNPAVAIMVIDHRATVDMVESARKAGAKAFVAVGATSAEFRHLVLGLLAGSREFLLAGQPLAPDERSDPLLQLSPAQRRVVNELAQGKSNREIAETLCLSEATIKSHLYAIYKALDVRNRTQALLKLQEI